MTTIPIHPIEATVDTGTAYGLPAPRHKAELTEIGPGTPMGDHHFRIYTVGRVKAAGELVRFEAGNDLLSTGQGRPPDAPAWGAHHRGPGGCGWRKGQ